MPVILNTCGAQSACSVSLDQLPPTRELFMTKAVPLAGLLERDQVFLNSAYNLRFPANDPAFGTCRRQLSKSVVRALIGLC